MTPPESVGAAQRLPEEDPTVEEVRAVLQLNALCLTMTHAMGESEESLCKTT